MIQKRYCSLCKRDFYNGYAHIISYGHKIKAQMKRAQEEAEEERRKKENDFAIQLASALEGHTLNQGDEVSLRDGREFKVDIHGTLFEIPIGS